VLQGVEQIVRAFPLLGAMRQEAGQADWRALSQ